MKNSENPAYPVALNPGEGPIKHSDGSLKDIDGLTKRERYAMAAMQGILSNLGLIDTLSVSDMGWTADEAVHQADALLARLEEGRT